MDANAVLSQLLSRGQIDASRLGLGAQYDLRAPEGFENLPAGDQYMFARDIANELNQASQKTGILSGFSSGLGEAVRGFQTNRATIKAIEDRYVDPTESADIYAQMQANQQQAAEGYTGSKTWREAWQRSDGALDTVQRTMAVMANGFGTSAVPLIASIFPATTTAKTATMLGAPPPVAFAAGAVGGMVGGTAERRKLGTAQVVERAIAGMAQNDAPQTHEMDFARAERLMTGSGPIQGLADLLAIYPAFRSMKFLAKNGFSAAERAALQQTMKSGSASILSKEAAQHLVGKLGNLIKQASPGIPRTTARTVGRIGGAGAAEYGAEYTDQYLQQVAAQDRGDWQEVYDNPELAAERREAGEMGALLGTGLSGIAGGVGGARNMSTTRKMRDMEQAIAQAEQQRQAADTERGGAEVVGPMAYTPGELQRAEQARIAKIEQQRAAIAQQEQAETQRRLQSGDLYNKEGQGQLLADNNQGLAGAPPVREFQTEESIPYEDTIREDDAVDIRVDRALRKLPITSVPGPIYNRLVAALEAQQTAMGPVSLDTLASGVQQDNALPAAVRQLAARIRQSERALSEPPPPTRDVPPIQEDFVTEQIQQRAIAQQEQAETQRRLQAGELYDEAGQGQLLTPIGESAQEELNTRHEEYLRQQIPPTWNTQVEDALGNLPNAPGFPPAVYDKFAEELRTRAVRYYNEHKQPATLKELTTEIAGDTALPNKQVRGLAATVHRGMRHAPRAEPLTNFVPPQQIPLISEPASEVTPQSTLTAEPTTPQQAPPYAPQIQGALDKLSKRPTYPSTTHQALEAQVQQRAAAYLATRGAPATLAELVTDIAGDTNLKDRRVRNLAAAIHQGITGAKQRAALDSFEQNADAPEPAEVPTKPVRAQKEKYDPEARRRAEKKNETEAQQAAGLSEGKAAQVIGDTPFPVLFDTTIAEDGLYDPNTDTIILNPSRHRTPEELLNTLAHEVTHRGLVSGRLAAPAAEAERTAKELIRTDPKWKAVAERLQEQGYDPESDTFTEEVMVAVHQQEQGTKMPVFRRLVTAIKGLLREVPVLRRLVSSMDEADVLALLRRAEATGRQSTATDTQATTVRQSLSPAANNAIERQLKKGLSRATTEPRPDQTRTLQQYKAELPSKAKETVNSFLNGWVDNFASVSAKLRERSNDSLYINIGDNAVLRGDVLASHALHAEQVTIDGLEAGAWEIDAFGIMRTAPPGTNKGLPKAVQILRDGAQRIGRTAKEMTELFRRYVVASRLKDIHDTTLAVMERNKTQYAAEVKLFEDLNTQIKALTTQIDILTQFKNTTNDKQDVTKQIQALEQQKRTLRQQRPSRHAYKQAQAKLKTTEAAYEKLANFVDATATEFNLNNLVGYQEDQINNTIRMVQDIPELEQARKLIRDILRSVADMEYQSGLIDKDTHTAYQGEWYYPIRREWVDPETNQVKHYDVGTPRGLERAARFMGKELKGSVTLDIGDPLLAVQNHARKFVTLAMQNHGAQVLADQLTHIGAAQTTREDGKPLTHEDVHDPGGRLLPNAVEFMRDGKRTWVLLDDENDTLAFKTHASVTNMFLPALQTTSSFVRKTITTNPAFTAAQVIMDAVNAMVMAGVKHPFRVFTQSLKITGELMKDVVKHRPHTNPYAVALKRYGQGIRPEFVTHNANDFLLNKIEKESALGRWWDNSNLNSIVQFFDRLAAASDMGARSAIYAEILADTNNQPQALAAAREVINYHRRGTHPIVDFVIKSVPFTTSFIQGTNVALRVYANKGNIAGHDKAQAARLFRANALKLAMAGAVYALLMSDDDDFYETDPALRARGIYIPLGNGEYIVAPLRAEVGLPFFFLPQLIVKAMLKESADGPQSIKEGFRAMQGLLMGLPIPKAVQPLVEVKTNYNMFTRDSIVPANMADLPGELQKTSATGDLAKGAANVTGISALKWDHIFNSYFNSVAALVNVATYNLLGMIGNEERPDRGWSQNPLTRRFIKAPDNYALGEAYEVINESTKIYSAWLKAQKIGDTETLNEIATKHQAELARGRQMHSWRTYLGAVNRAIERNRHRKDITDTERHTRDISLKVARKRIAVELQKRVRQEQE